MSYTWSIHAQQMAVHLMPLHSGHHQQPNVRRCAFTRRDLVLLLGLTSTQSLPGKQVPLFIFDHHRLIISSLTSSGTDHDLDCQGLAPHHLARPHVERHLPRPCSGLAWP